MAAPHPRPPASAARLDASLRSLLLLGAACLLVLALPACAQDDMSRCRAILPKCGPGQPCADILVDGPRVQRSAHVEMATMTRTSCAVLEGCTAPGNRKLLRFDFATPNIGRADLNLGNPGSPSMAPCFTWSGCHNHYHFQSFASYTLLRGNTVVARGAKASTCLQDALRWPGSNAPTKPSGNLFTCARQGISRGYQDVYGSHLDCQWIDVTDVPAGSYTLRVEVNPDRLLAEENYSNNAVSVPVTIPASPTTPSPTPTSCRNYGGCGSCTQGTGCGWCSSNGGCYYGTYLGPSSGQCADWIWSNSRCVSSAPSTQTCSAQTTCGGCAGVTGCGWCPATNKCQPGTSAGPSSGSCALWQFGSSNQCGNCPAQTNCGSCTKSTGCGWCAATNRCSSGTWLGPGSGTCNNNWIWSNSQCSASGGGGSTPTPNPNPTPNPTDPNADAMARCRAQSGDCTACARTTGCGWCPGASSNQRCSYGNWLGPQGSTCSNWIWSAATCSASQPSQPSQPPANDQCSSKTSCLPCTQTTGCGWCSATSRCSSGVWTGPTSATCSNAATNWIWSQSKCTAPPPSAETTCRAQRDCNSCATTRGCGWCPTNNQCNSGTWLGPNSYSCPRWIWSAATCTNARMGRAANRVTGSARTAQTAGAELLSADEFAVGLPSPTAAEPLGTFLKQSEVSIDETLKCDADGNSFKADMLGSGLKEDDAGNFLKERDDINLDEVPLPAVARAANGALQVVQMDVAPEVVVDPYDPDPSNQDWPHGHVEPLHSIDGEASGEMPPMDHDHDHGGSDGNAGGDGDGGAPAEGSTGTVDTIVTPVTEEPAPSDVNVGIDGDEIVIKPNGAAPTASAALALVLACILSAFMAHQ